MSRGRKIQTTGMVFCDSIKKRTHEINQLKRLYKDVKIHILDDMILYDVFEDKGSNMVHNY